MSKVAAARRELERGGVPALTKASRRWLAGVIYPGQIPRRPKRVSAPKALAESVSYDAAAAWFEKRRATYLRLSEVAAPYVDANGVFFDVGANIGYFTKILGETIGFNGTAHLFEPLPHLARHCRQTASELPFRAEVHEFGLSDSDGMVKLFLAADGNLGWNTLISKSASAAMVPVEVRVHPFDSCGIKAVPSFLKIDVEGAEYRVLTGMLAALEHWSPRPTILCEIGWGQKHPEWERELAVFDRLRQLGYVSVNLDGEPTELRDITRTTDVLFLPEGAGRSGGG